MRSILRWSLLCLLLIGTSSAMAQQFDFKVNARIPVDTAVTVGTLDNGLNYYIRSNQKPEERAELRLVVNAGSILEDEDQQGLAHLCEHMAFNGSAHFAKNELIDYLESIGMKFGPEINAYTSFDETVYKLQVPTDSLAITAKALDILVDWAHLVSYEPEEIDKERGVVIEEWRLGRGAQMRMMDKQFPILFKDSQYAVRLPIGKKDILDDFVHPTLTRFYQDWYRPDLMAVVAVGDFDKKWMEQQIKAKFGGIPSHANPRPRGIFNVPDHKEPLFAITPDPEATRTIINLYFKHDISAQETVGDYRFRILEQLFSRMMTQRLTELTQQAEAPFLHAVVGNGNYVRTKKVVYLAALVNDDGINNGIDALYTEARRVQQFGFTATELEREKKNAIRVMEQLFNERDKTESVRFAEEYVRNFLQNEPIPGIAFEFELYKNHLAGIELAEINELAQKLTRDENQVIVVGMPEKEGVVVPTEAELQAVIMAAKKNPVTPYVDTVSEKPLLAKLPTPGKVVSSKEYANVGVTEWILSNGVRVVLKPTNFKNDEIKFTAYSPGGYSLCPDSSYIAAITAPDVVAEGGIADFTSIELAKLLAGKVVRVGPFITDLSEGMFGSTTIQDLETMFQLVYLNFTAPREDSTAYFAYQEKMRGVLTNRSAKPEAAFRDTIDVALAQNHFRARPWSLDMIDEMDLHKSVAFYRDRFADADDFTFIFVGKFDLEKFQPLVEQYLGSLPVLLRDETWRDVGIDPPAGVIEKTVIRGLEPKSRVSLRFTGDYEWSLENNYAFLSMVDVLRIKLRKAVREDKSGTYGVSVKGHPQRYPDEEYQIAISFGCAPDRVDELIGIIWSQLDSLQQNPAEEFYLNKVRETQSRSFEVKIKKNGYWLGRLKQAYWYDLPLESIIDYPKMIETLDGDLVRDAAQKYFDEKNYLKVVLYPESTN